MRKIADPFAYYVYMDHERFPGKSKVIVEWHDDRDIYDFGERKFEKDIFPIDIKEVFIDWCDDFNDELVANVKGKFYNWIEGM